MSDNSHDSYINPLTRRYASKEMQRIFSDDIKFSTWRRLWVALAEAERELGLDITDAQIYEMKAHLTDIDYAAADANEKRVRHDVMAHVLAYGEQCPDAKPIIHLGATSCYVGDNTDLIVMRDALKLVKKLLVTALKAVCKFAEDNKNLATLAFTHFQAAQPTTVGKRATLWANDILMDIEQIDFVLSQLKFLGCRGTTGTCASFLALFGGDHNKVKRLEAIIASKFDFGACYPVSGQTYSRKVDYFALSALSGIAQSAHKFSNDIRLLSHLKEADEPFESGQIGSSAMAYKRNPMRSERIASLARYVIADAQNAAMTAGEQWFERTLDDSANKRISVPEAFLAIDGILSLYINIISGLKVYPKVIAKHLSEELPFMATENILMYCVKKGGDRQTLHEAIRTHSVAAGLRVKEEGAANDLFERILNDKTFGLTADELREIADPAKFTGRSPEQVDEFLAIANEVIAANGDLGGADVEIVV
ncbi:adenylosuccinate lyase [Clostridia bacterium]|nr:adenylosuccinate lyase [Clostridia bacterium]